MSTTSYSFRIDTETKTALDRVCQAIGLSTAAAFNMFAKRMVAEGGFPFVPSVQPSQSVTSALRVAQEKTKNYDVSEDDILDLVL